MELKINLLQTDILWASPEANRQRAAALMRTMPRADICILPEMFTTGFAPDPSGMAERMSHGTCPTLEWMKGMARELDAAVAGSIALVEEDGGRCYNRLLFVRPDGTTTTYDKHHLFTHAGEHLHYTPGTHRVVASFRGARILLQTCYDLRFPVFSRNSASNPYDIIIYVASWPSSRIAAWMALQKARAIENQCYVCAVNRVGSDPQCQYTGGTLATDPRGNTIAQCPEGQEAAVCARLDMDALARFRERFPVLDDADI